MAAWPVRLGLPLTPARRRGTEFLDDPGLDAAVRRRSHRDIALANRLLGGSRALKEGLDACFAGAPSRALTLLDVGTGSGETLVLAAAVARRHGIHLTAVGLDIDERMVRTARRGMDAAWICASALQLPIASRGVDVVTCSLLLHHFEDPALATLIREADRVARHRVIIHDLRRSYVAAAGLWAVSWPLGFHPVSRHDGVTSVLRGFTDGELSRLVTATVGVAPQVTRYLGFRLLATWTPGPVGLRTARPSE
jgi:SAM-dependent methyltransferase